MKKEKQSLSPDPSSLRRNGETNLSLDEQFNFLDIVSKNNYFISIHCAYCIEHL